MIVSVRNIDGSAEWCVIELQGEVLGDLNGEMGSLTVNGDKNAILEIGQHILEGEIMSLKLPFLIVEKTEEREGVSVCGIVRRKLIFNSRPKNKKIAK